MLTKKMSLFAISFLLFSLNVFSQSNSPIIGYDKVAWGASIQAVTQAYPTIKEHESAVSASEKAIGVRHFIQGNVGNGIDFRAFSFYNNKLYRVLVCYEENTAAVFNALSSKLVDIYGKFDKEDVFSRPNGNDTQEVLDLIRYYNKDLKIILRAIETLNQQGRYISTPLSCIYSNPNIENDIEIAKTKQKGNNLGL